MLSALGLNPRAVSNTRRACARSSPTVRVGSFCGDNGGENGSGSLSELRQRAQVSLLAFLLFPYQTLRFPFLLPAEVLQSCALVLDLVAAFGLLLVAIAEGSFDFAPLVQLAEPDLSAQDD
jgi:hypothetical protein